jgi:NAD(P)-dependent dehydrogenase (short-subunit alcohol dehydrogenase family)
MSSSNEPPMARYSALVFGGGSGIGVAAAICIARSGSRVTISGRTLSRLESGKKAILDQVPNAMVFCVTGDATSEADVAR